MHPVAVRTLIADPDWEFLRRASQALPRSGYHVIVETDRRKALTFAKHWQPTVLIAPTRFLEDWQQDEQCGPPDRALFPHVLITAYGSDEPGIWQRWAARGYEVLLKPLVHPTQLQAAIDAALRKAPRLEGSYVSA